MKTLLFNIYTKVAEVVETIAEILLANFGGQQPTLGEDVRQKKNNKKEK